MLFFIEAVSEGEDMNWFVRARSPREAFEMWRTSDFVQMMAPAGAGVEGDVRVWIVPDPSGPLGPVDWVYSDCSQGRTAADFPESLE
jgi:hypothetical protein